MSNVDSLFRRAAFGGFNRDDVVVYIEKLKNEFFAYQKQAEQDIKELNERIAELENMLSHQNEAEPTELSNASQADSKEQTQKSEMQESLSASVTQINSAATHLEEAADRICDSLDGFIESLCLNAIPLAINTQAPADESESVSAQEQSTDTDSVSEEIQTQENTKSIFADIVELASTTDKKDKNIAENTETVTDNTTDDLFGFFGL